MIKPNLRSISFPVLRVVALGLFGCVYCYGVVGCFGAGADDLGAKRLDDVWKALYQASEGMVATMAEMDAWGRKKGEQLPWTERDDWDPPTLDEQRVEVVRKLRERLDVTEEQGAELLRLFGTYRTGQGNPEVTHHPMSRRTCREIRAKAKTHGESALCGAKNMVALYDPEAGETEKDARVCIDQYEFPNIPCEYPLTWVRASQAQKICKVLGKRLCDAHEWEGACYGRLLAPDEEYAWTLGRENMSGLHNFNNRKNGMIRWAYGPTMDQSLCATTSAKSNKCVASEWEYCGSNTFPAGAFPSCVSFFGVYDQHGNAAEHMSLPLKPDQLGSRGGSGRTEMKGSWFIFSNYQAHEDDCRWRAPDWHGSAVTDENSHSNYHLGFRCCKDIVSVDGLRAGADKGLEKDEKGPETESDESVDAAAD